MREINLLLVNIDASTGLAETVPYLFQSKGIGAIIEIKSIEWSRLSEVWPSEKVDYLIIDPIIRGEVDDDLQKMIEQRLRSGSKVVVLTTSTPYEAPDTVFKEMGVDSIARIPSSFDVLRNKIVIE